MSHMAYTKWCYIENEHLAFSRVLTSYTTHFSFHMQASPVSNLLPFMTLTACLFLILLLLFSSINDDNDGSPRLFHILIMFSDSFLQYCRFEKCPNFFRRLVFPSTREFVDIFFSFSLFLFISDAFLFSTRISFTLWMKAC